MNPISTANILQRNKHRIWKFETVLKRPCIVWLDSIGIIFSSGMLVAVIVIYFISVSKSDQIRSSQQFGLGVGCFILFLMLLLHLLNIIGYLKQNYKILNYSKCLLGLFSAISLVTLNPILLLFYYTLTIETTDLLIYYRKIAVLKGKIPYDERFETIEKLKDVNLCFC